MVSPGSEATKANMNNRYLVILKNWDEEKLSFNEAKEFFKAKAKEIGLDKFQELAPCNNIWYHNTRAFDFERGMKDRVDWEETLSKDAKKKHRNRFHAWKISDAPFGSDNSDLFMTGDRLARSTFLPDTYGRDNLFHFVVEM